MKACLQPAAALFLIGGSISSALAQQTNWEFWPEWDVYFQVGPHARAVVVNSMNSDLSTRSRDGAFAYYLEVSLRPVFRKELRWRNDVFRQRYLSFRVGYLYSTSLGAAQGPPENRAIFEVTPRFSLPGGIVMATRNRTELRLVEGNASVRNRTRLRASRDVAIGRLEMTPSAYAEAFYDTRVDAWANYRFALTVEVPAGPHLVLEPYILREHNRITGLRTNALGLTFNLYF